MAITTSSNTAFIEAQQYSQFILENLHDGLLPTNFYRNVSDFGSGTTLNIKTIGTVTIQEITENEDITFNPIDTGVVQLQITEHIGDGFFITEAMRQDGSQVEALLAARASEGMRAIQENFETTFLNTMNASQTLNDRNLINGFSHRFLASGSNNTLVQKDLIDMRLSFDKANVPMENRIAIVDPVSAAALAKTAQLVTNLDAAGPLFQELVKDGFDKEHQFVTMLSGWQIWTSNRLPAITAETLTLADGTGSTSFTGTSNLFMSIRDDQTKPGMVAWRQLPRTETDREITKGSGRDIFTNTARWGDGAQRLDTLAVIATNATATE